MTRQIARGLAVALISLSALSAHGSLATQNIALNGLGLVGDTNPATNVAEIPMSFTDPNTGGTVSYTLEITMNWVDSGGFSVSGLTGAIFGNTVNLGANTQVGINPQDTGSIEEISLDGGGTALEQLVFGVSNVANTGGSVSFLGFDNVTGNSGLSSANVAGTTVFSTTATAGNAFRLSGIDANFDTDLPVAPPTAVPEPGTWMMFGLLGLLLSVRAYQVRENKVTEK